MSHCLALTVALSLAAGCGSSGKKDEPTDTPDKPAPKVDTAALLAEGKKAEEDGKYSEARDKYLAVLQADRDNKEATQRVEGLDEVIESQKQIEANAASANDRRAQLEVRLADALRKHGNVDAATTHYKAAVELKPDTPTAHVGMGVLAVEQGSFKDALASYTKAIEADPQCAAAFYELAFLNRTAQVEGASPQKALENAARAVALAPTNAAYLELLAECQKDGGEMEKATQTLEEAVKASNGSKRLQDKLDAWKGSKGGDAPKPDAPKPDAPKGDAPTGDAPKADAPKADAPKADAPADAPKADAPKADAPADAPKADAPK